ncbi:adenosine deaminase [Pasteurellaceae bacterium Macca]|nr:adenosine deaminase [Pasteurellaceae bacterium Macca]
MHGFSHYGLIDLHLHLDGSLTPEWMITWAAKQQITLPTQDPTALKSLISAPADCADLNQYLASFEIPLQLLQRPEALTNAVEDLIQRLDQQGLRYAEIRFAPQLHQRENMSQQQAVEAVLQGLQAVKKCQSLYRVNVILCCMRGADNQSQNEETVRLAHQFLTQKATQNEPMGVVAVDLAGAEALYPTAQFAPIFQLANHLGVPFTLHAGEADGAESVQQALDFGAKRIGHGIRVRENAHILAQLIRQKTPLEMCPCSNLQTKTVACWEDYPLRHYLQQGVVATVNTDNMTVSQTHIQHEFRQLAQHIQLSHEEAKQLVENAIQASFLTDEEKDHLRHLIRPQLTQP